MPLTPEEHIEMSRQWLFDAQAAAENWQQKGDLGWALFCNLDAARHLLSIGVMRYADQEGIDFLRGEAQSPRCPFNLIEPQLAAIYADLSRRGPPPSIFDLSLIIHVQSILGRFGAAARLARMSAPSLTSAVFQPYTLGVQYLQALRGLHTGISAPVSPRRYSGYERHLALYIPLMDALTRREDSSSSFAAVTTSFRQRNSDKRLIGDGLFGDGTFPVRWDFILQGILRWTGHTSTRSVAGETTGA